MVNYELKGKMTKKVYDMIMSTDSLTLKEIAEKTGVNYNTVRGAVHRLQKRGLIKRVEGVYIGL